MILIALIFAEQTTTDMTKNIRSRSEGTSAPSHAKSKKASRFSGPTSLCTQLLRMVRNKHEFASWILVI